MKHLLGFLTRWKVLALLGCALYALHLALAANQARIEAMGSPSAVAKFAAQLLWNQVTSSYYDR